MHAVYSGIDVHVVYLFHCTLTPVRTYYALHIRLSKHSLSLFLSPSTTRLSDLLTLHTYLQSVLYTYKHPTSTPTKLTLNTPGSYSRAKREEGLGLRIYALCCLEERRGSLLWPSSPSWLFSVVLLAVPRPFTDFSSSPSSLSL